MKTLFYLRWNHKKRRDQIYVVLFVELFAKLQLALLTIVILSATAQAQNIQLVKQVDPLPNDNREERFTDVWADGDYAYIGSLLENVGVSIINISTPGSAFRAATYDPGPSRNFIDVKVKDGIGYFANDYFNTEGKPLGDGVHIVDLSDPTSPRLITKIDSADGGFDNVHNVFIHENYLFEVSQGSDTLKVFDVSLPIDDMTSPVAEIVTQDPIGTLITGLHDVTVIDHADRGYPEKGTRLYVSVLRGYLLFDISSSFEDQFPVSGGNERIEVSMSLRNELENNGLELSPYILLDGFNDPRLAEAGITGWLLVEFRTQEEKDKYKKHEPANVYTLYHIAKEGSSKINIYGGGTEIYDVSDIGNSAYTCLGTINTGNLSHSNWPTDDGNFLVSIQELSELEDNTNGVRIYDISNLDPTTCEESNLDLEPVFIITEDLLGVGIEAFSPHNCLIMDNLLFISWYEAGLQVFDISDPTNPVSAGSFCTYAGPVGGAKGNWGVYPFLGLDRVLLSDRDGGLFIVDANGVVRGEPSLAEIYAQTFPGNTLPPETEDSGLFTESDGSVDIVVRFSGTQRFELGTYQGANEETLLSDAKPGDTVVLDEDGEFGFWVKAFGGVADGGQFFSQSERNLGPFLAPLQLVIENITSPAVTPVSPDGITPEGKPFYDYSSFDCAPFLSGETTEARRLAFDNPTRARFQFEAGFRADIDRFRFYSTPNPNEWFVGYEDWIDSDFNDLVFVVRRVTLTAGTALTDVTANSQLNQFGRRFDRHTGQFSVMASWTNIGQDPFAAPSIQTTIAPVQWDSPPNFPNPFNPETWIPFSLAEATDVTISIYDLQGRRVRELNLGHQQGGKYFTKEKAAYWDGRNHFGEPVGSGVYFYRLHAGDYQATRKMVILK